ncbi:PREDICTED: inducible metalloproteinase inhibitor protein-like [Papilio xuthus]|uniref:Inducible metalloproteinase inhibitor protein-like n=1 Tax=Papilio xuthus TaxID=66420 RepID=A0AAJ6ZRJ4_PAPXU|nr:PREDICTED: inducible metalloproteinase inhibitor protein-like [Papilio xuthus]
MLKILLVVGVVFIYTAYAAVVTCGPNEELNRCPSNCSDACPTRSGEFNNCRRPNRQHCPPPKCVCQFNYRRAENGTCIPARECPAFDCSNENEEYDPCPGYCPTDDCSQATPNGECPLFGLFLIVVECLPTCRCQPTYWRKDGVCVPYQQCLVNKDKSISQ